MKIIGKMFILNSGIGNSMNGVGIYFLIMSSIVLTMGILLDK